MKINTIPTFVFMAILSIVWTSCAKSDAYQKQVAITDGNWQSNNKPEFEIEITDTTSVYDLFLLLRHDDAYPYSNMWVRINIQQPGDSVYLVGERLEVTMADPEGKWLGRNFGDLWEQKAILSNDKYPIFTKPGTYKLKLEHLMRANPLENVLNVGINVQKRK